MKPKPQRPWVAILPTAAAAKAASVRLDDDVQAAFDSQENVVWLRGSDLSDKVCSLPFEALFRIDQSKRLFPLDSELPVRRLPDGLEWAPLSDLILPASQTPLFLTGEVGPTAGVKIVRGGAAAPANLLRVPLDVWCDFATAAPEIRLRPLSFAASETEALIRGNPLPPIQGESWVERDGIALKAGFCCEPGISPKVLKKVLGLMPHEIALLSQNGIVERIAAENFIPASRAAARLTLP